MIKRIIIMIIAAAILSCSPHRKTKFYKNDSKWEVNHDYGTFLENKKQTQ